MSDDDGSEAGLVLQKVRKYSRILRIKESSYKDVMVSLERLQSLVTSKKLLDATGIEPVVRNWCKIDDGPASVLARKIVKSWQSLNSSSSSRNRTASNSTTSLSSRSSASNISSHKNGRSFNRHLLKSPSLSPSSESGKETTTIPPPELTFEGVKENKVDPKSNNFSSKLEKSSKSSTANREQSKSNGDAAKSPNKSPSISISSSSEDEKSLANESFINKINSIQKQMAAKTELVTNDVNSSPSLIDLDDNQPDSCNISTTENNISLTVSAAPEFEKPDNELAINCRNDPNLQPKQELYSPGNPTGAVDVEDCGRSNSVDSSRSSTRDPPKKVKKKKDKKEVSVSNDVSKESSLSPPKSNVSVASTVMSSAVVTTVDDWKVSHQSEKLKNLKRRAALICNLPELASSAASDKEKDKDRRSRSGSGTRKRKKYKKEKKAKDRRKDKKEKDSKKDSRRKDHRRDYSDNRSRKRKSRSKSRSKETKDNNLQYDSLSGDESRSD